MRRLIFVRHGESTANVARDNTDSRETELTAKGREQARKTGDFLREFYNVTLICASPFKRTIDTADLINAALNVPIKTNELLIEAHNGVINGVHVSDINKTAAGRKWSKIYSEFKDVNPVEMTKPESKARAALKKAQAVVKAETDEELLKRVKKAMKWIRSQKTKGDIVVVSHGGVIKFMIKALFNISPLCWSVGNCSVCVVSHSGELELLARDGHLRE